MNDQATATEEDLTGGPDWDAAELPIDQWDDVEIDQWDDVEIDQWDDVEIDQWDGYAAAPRPTSAHQVPRRWHRDPRWLFGLIALAAAALVVATVLLVTGRGSGEIPTAPDLSTRTPASASSTPRPERSTPASSSPTTTPPTTTPSAPSTSEQPSTVDSPAPEQPAASVPEAPPAISPTRSPAGPRINVTRTPMSFSPGQH